MNVSSRSLVQRFKPVQEYQQLQEFMKCWCLQASKRILIFSSHRQQGPQVERHLHGDGWAVFGPCLPAHAVSTEPITMLRPRDAFRRSGLGGLAVPERHSSDDTNSQHQVSEHSSFQQSSAPHADRVDVQQQNYYLFLPAVWLQGAHARKEAKVLLSALSMRSVGHL